MGQFALGIRSLLIKSSIFVVMAALLAWALGGTLFPRPKMAALNGVVFDEAEWYWRLAVGGDEPNAIRWQLMVNRSGRRPAVFDAHEFSEVAGPIVVRDFLYVGGYLISEPRQARGWVIQRIAKGWGDAAATIYPMPDRLAVEHQLARVRDGLPLQDSQTILRQRPMVLDPEPVLDEEGPGPLSPPGGAGG